MVVATHPEEVVMKHVHFALQVAWPGLKAHCMLFFFFYWLSGTLVTEGKGQDILDQGRSTVVTSAGPPFGFNYSKPFTGGGESGMLSF